MFGVTLVFSSISTEAVKVPQLNETPLNLVVFTAGSGNTKLLVGTCRIHLLEYICELENAIFA